MPTSRLGQWFSPLPLFSWRGAAGPPAKRCYRTRTGNPLPLVAGILAKKTSFLAFAVTDVGRSMPSRDETGEGLKLGIGTDAVKVRFVFDELPIARIEDEIYGS